MRKFLIQEPDGDIVLTEEEIIRDYFPYWKNEMVKVGKENEISHKNCLEDFIVVNWAQEIKDE